eukprot:CAMPEP_0116039832 /NCGR_PEP_ID=MMETSP0321-20121206/23901_1 /TAXON_ID=163516 /ORGANISM="Leptocylindrus danicus var. danicus, Strain B650" /LENGTH=593 /DNA_ID=CAMNT_0003519337 /DNA_START=66 /DNA_END=1844 /DNA_ORIENTATION=-
MNLESTNPIDYESDKRKRKVLVDLGDNGVGFSSSQTTKLSRQPKKKIISSDVENLDPVLHSINQASQQRCSSGSSTSKKGGSSSSSADSQCNPRTDVVFARNVRGPSDRPINLLRVMVAENCEHYGQTRKRKEKTAIVLKTLEQFEESYPTSGFFVSAKSGTEKMKRTEVIKKISTMLQYKWRFDKQRKEKSMKQSVKLKAAVANLDYEIQRNKYHAYMCPGGCLKLDCTFASLDKNDIYKHRAGVNFPSKHFKPFGTGQEVKLSWCAGKCGKSHCTFQYGTEGCLNGHNKNANSCTFLCTVCKAVFTQKNTLTRHMRNIHGQVESHGETSQTRQRLAPEVFDIFLQAYPNIKLCPKLQTMWLNGGYSYVKTMVTNGIDTDIRKKRGIEISADDKMKILAEILMRINTTSMHRDESHDEVGGSLPNGIKLGPHSGVWQQISLDRKDNTLPHFDMDNSSYTKNCRIVALCSNHPSNLSVALGPDMCNYIRKNIVKSHSEPNLKDFNNLSQDDKVHMRKSLRRIWHGDEKAKVDFGTFENFYNYAKQLLIDQKFRCALSDIRLWDQNEGEDGTPSLRAWFKLSLDAIDPIKGHIE